MRGRGMMVVLVPHFSGHFGQSFSGDISVILFHAHQRKKCHDKIRISSDCRTRSTASPRVRTRYPRQSKRGRSRPGTKSTIGAFPNATRPKPRSPKESR